MSTGHRLGPRWCEGLGAADPVERVQRGVALHLTLPRPPIGCTPSEVVHRQNKLELRAYSAAAPTEPTPVVIVPSLINGAAIVDLEPDRSLVRGLTERGHRVYVVDWGIPGLEDAHHDVAHVVLTLLHRAVDRACRHAGAPTAHLLGYCQGGTLAAMYTALRPHRVATLVNMAGPVRFSEAGRFRQFVEHIDTDAVFGPDRLVSTDLMGAAFKLLDPMGNWTKFINLDAAADDESELRRSLARERWLEENVPAPGAFAAEFIKLGYQEDRLLEGTWSLRGEAVDLGRIQCPVFTVACRRDFIAPAAAVTPLAEAVGSQTVRLEVLDTGHIGMVVGSFGPRVFYPMLDAWLRTEGAKA